MYLTQALHRSVQQDPDRPMTVFGDRIRTTREVHDRVSRLAGGLRGLGVRPGDRVGILSFNSDRYHEYLLAVPWLGAVLNPVNVRWSPDEVAYSLQDSDTRVLLIDDAFAPSIPALRERWPGLRAVVHCGDGELPDGAVDYEALVSESSPIDDTRTGGDATLGIFYTGGTTGTPKGVVLSHHNLLTSALGSLATGQFVTPGGRLLHAAPMFHLADLTAWCAGCVVGATHVITPFFSSAQVVASIARHRVTDVLLVPTMIQLLVDDPGTAAADLDSLRHLVYGASPMSEGLLDRARRAFPNTGFTQAYGMTELSPVATLLLPDEHDDPVLRRSAGRAAPHSEVRIVDPDDRELPLGTVGEVTVRGDHVMLGYWNRPQDTENAVRDGWMHTGDGGYMDENGYVFVVDRIKDMIISGGENVYSVEVENALTKHPAVAMCAVIGVPDDQWGERVHAVVVLRPECTATESDLRDHVGSLIAGYKSPRTIDFVDSLPMSGAGKILKRELRRQVRPTSGTRVS